MVHSLNKGKQGEREAANWLQQQFKLEFTPTRNLNQTREGGHDLDGFPPFKIEVKRQVTLNLKSWWEQATNSCGAGDCAVVMYRQNRKQWRFLIPAEVIGVKRGYIILEGREFVLWASKHINDIAI